jgi:predicted transcriptional regulator YheO
LKKCPPNGIMVYMEEKQKIKTIRMTMPNHLYKRFKMLCVRFDLSMTKQTAELVRKFVETHDQEIR